MFGNWFTIPGLKCWVVDLPSQDSSVGQLFYLPRLQVLGSCFSFPGLKCLALVHLPSFQLLGSLLSFRGLKSWAVALPTQESSVGQLI